MKPSRGVLTLASTGGWVADQQTLKKATNKTRTSVRDFEAISNIELIRVSGRVVSVTMATVGPF